jgi:hypothetical protein
MKKISEAQKATNNRVNAKAFAKKLKRQAKKAAAAKAAS